MSVTMDSNAHVLQDSALDVPKDSEARTPPLSLSSSSSLSSLTAAAAAASALAPGSGVVVAATGSASASAVGDAKGSGCDDDERDPLGILLILRRALGCVPLSTTTTSATTATPDKTGTCATSVTANPTSPPARVSDVRSYRVLGTIRQANAEGARVVARVSCAHRRHCGRHPSDQKQNDDGFDDEHEQEEVGEEGEGEVHLFVKRVDATRIVPEKTTLGKSMSDLNRTMTYARTEVRFYSEFVPRLLPSPSPYSSLGPEPQSAVTTVAASKSWVPQCYLAECDVSGLVGGDDDDDDDDDNNNDENNKHNSNDEDGKSGHGGLNVTTTLADLRPCDYEGKGGTLVLSDINPAQYYQRSPLNVDEASTCLEAVAKLHASAWQNRRLGGGKNGVGVLTEASTRLGPFGGSYHLSVRHPKECHDMERSWEKFRGEFRRGLNACSSSLPSSSSSSSSSSSTTTMTTAAVGSSAPDIWDRPSVIDLGRRMKRMAQYVSDELSPSAEDKYATLVHGDLKAMNIFLPVVGHDDDDNDDAKEVNGMEKKDGAGVFEKGQSVAAAAVKKSNKQKRDKRSTRNGAILIDFASTGIGYGMSDVAMLLAHSVRPEDLSSHGGKGGNDDDDVSDDDGGDCGGMGDGEKRLVDKYINALHAARAESSTACASESNNDGNGIDGNNDGVSSAPASIDMATAVIEPYPRKYAYRHYRLAVVDYFRFVLGRFYGSATVDGFRKRAGSQNCTYVNRNMESAIAFIDRADRYLAEFEKEREERERERT